MKKIINYALVLSMLMTAQTIITAHACADAVCFVLREYNGHIALLEEGVDEPLAVYKTTIDSLYPADAKLLKEGIRLCDRAELMRLIEDLELE